MRTPKEFINNLNKKIITGTMLEAALYSVNKRAKNWRDTSRENRHTKYWSRYTDRNIQKAEENEAKYYKQKEVLLSLLTPVCIHREFAGYKRKRIYSYDPDYEEKLFSAILSNTCVWQNSYFDHDIQEEVFFFDCIDKKLPQYRYYLYYHLGNHTFHTPINDCSRYSYPVEDIGFLETKGADIEELISVQFIQRMVSLIESGEYMFENDLANEPLPVFNNTVMEEYDYDFFCIKDVWNLIKPILNKAALSIPEDYDYPVKDEVRKNIVKSFEHLIESNHSAACSNIKKMEALEQLKKSGMSEVELQRKARRKKYSQRGGRRYILDRFSVGIQDFTNFGKDLNSYCMSRTEYSRQDFVSFLISAKESLTAKEINEKVQDWYKSKKVWEELLEKFKESQEYEFQKKLLQRVDK